MMGITTTLFLAAAIQVAPAQTAPAQVLISPERAEIEVAETAQLTLTARDGAGRTLSDVLVRWIASTPELASVDQSGVVTALNPGMAKITAVVDRDPDLGVGGDPRTPTRGAASLGWDRICPTPVRWFRFG